MQIYGIDEAKGYNYITYTFQKPDYFYEAGYKMMRLQQGELFVPCNLVKYNGNIRLIYRIEEMASLTNLVKNMDYESFLKMILNVVKNIIQIKNNGFILLENIDFNPDSIYIKTDTLNSLFMYIPFLNQGSAEGCQNTENYIRQVFSCIIQTYLMNNEKALILQNKLNNYTYSFEDIKKYIDELVSNLGEYEEEKNKNENSEKVLNNKTGKKKKADNSYLMITGQNTSENVSFLIDKDVFIIGHKKDSVDGYIEFDNSISRIHCKIIKKDNKYYIVDLNSANGTFVNGKRVRVNQQTEITTGDIIKLSDCDFIITSTSKVRRKNKCVRKSL